MYIFDTFSAGTAAFPVDTARLHVSMETLERDITNAMRYGTAADSS